MNCREAERHIFADPGALSEPQRAALAQHVTGCAACSRIQNQLIGGIDVLRQNVGDATVPDAELEWHKVRRVIRGAPTTTARPVAKWLGLPMAAAAAIAIGLYLAPTAHQSGPTPEHGAIAVQAATASSPAPSSTVVFVDDKSGWTFVVADDDTGQHI